MFARAEGTKVRVGFHAEDPAVYAQVIAELTEAEKDFSAHLSELSTAELRPYDERLQAAADDFDELFTELLTIEQAENLERVLFKAIIQSKTADGRFEGVEGCEVIPFPMHRVRPALHPGPMPAA